MKIIKTKNIPIKIWGKDIDFETIKQIERIAEMPFAFKHAILLPDAHFGYELPIGGVLATKDFILPRSVGSDIGCGVKAIKTSIHVKDFLCNKPEKILEDIKRKIPMGVGKGFNKRRRKVWNGFNEIPDIKILEEGLPTAKKQLGTLGAGNHFIEIQKDSKDFIWLMLHSGSRNLGNKIFTHYGSKDMLKNGNEIIYFHKSFLLGIEYKECMDFAIKYATANRFYMMEDIKEVLTKYFPFEIEFEVESVHNYASTENHFGEDVIIHRKGAIKAEKGTLALIPGSQGTKSYVIKGKGNSESFFSCSHGAGRIMSRSNAKKQLDLKTEKGRLDDLGIFHSLKHKKDLEEAPSAYKNIDQVIEQQSDLIKIVDILEPIAVLKG